jgi:hypothetical protein
MRVMRVRALTAIIVGHEAGTVSYGYGEQFDLPDHEAWAHIAAGNVEAVAPRPAAATPSTPETATMPARGEQAVLPRKKPGR